MNKAVLFDLDGTVMDSLLDLTDAMNAMLIKFGFNVITPEQMRAVLGAPSREIVRLSINKQISEQLLDECLDSYTEFYVGGKSPKTFVFDGIKNVIDQLKKRGFKIFAVTNKPVHEIEPIKERLLVPLGFDKVLGVTDGVEPKPNPKGTLNLLKEFDIKPENAYFVGDGETDVLTAINAKVNCIAVLWGNRDKEFLSKYGATTFAKNPEELLEIIK